MQVQNPSAAFVLRLKFALAAAGVVLFCLPGRVALAQQPGSTAPDSAPSARALVHILDYMGQDYSVAVADGEIINTAEYEEMTGFGASAVALLRDLNAAGVVPPDSALTAQVAALQSAVLDKASPDTIARMAGTIRDEVIRRSGLEVAPLRWPDPANGQQLYSQLCTNCHGASGAGDGPLAPTLDPAPTNFVEGERIASISPFQAYNTIRMGVDGTAMMAYRQLTDQEVWDLAFYVKSLQAAQQHPDIVEEVRAEVDGLKGAVSLEQVATLNDADLAHVLAQGGVEQPGTAVAALRTAGPGAAAGNSLDKALDYLSLARTNYKEGNVSEARQQSVLAYLEGIEPVEPTLTATDPTLTILLEQRMMAVRNAIEKGRDAEEVSRAVDLAMVSIGQARDKLQQREHSAWFAFLMAASILLREGLEAFLIILAVLGVIRAVGHKRAAIWVHAGWVFAVLLGVIAWFFSDRLIRFGAAQREFMEGGIALLAVVVLLYVGFWLHSKTEINKWKEFIDVRVKNVLQGGNLMGLAAISFFAVFREAIESVLFLSALTLEEGPDSKMAIAAGAVLAIIGVLVIAAVLLRYSARLPIRSLFKYSSFVMGVLSVILVGKGLHAIQEAGLLSITMAPVSLRFGLFGIYPTVETLTAQVVIILLVALLWTLPNRLAARAATA